MDERTGSNTYLFRLNVRLNCSIYLLIEIISLDHELNITVIVISTYNTRIKVEQLYFSSKTCPKLYTHFIKQTFVHTNIQNRKKFVIEKLYKMVCNDQKLYAGL